MPKSPVNFSCLILSLLHFVINSDLQCSPGGVCAKCQVMIEVNWSIPSMFRYRLLELPHESPKVRPDSGTKIQPFNVLCWSRFGMILEQKYSAAKVVSGLLLCACVPALPCLTLKELCVSTWVLVGSQWQAQATQHDGNSKNDEHAAIVPYA